MVAANRKWSVSAVDSGQTAFRPRVYELLINANAAAALGLEIPEMLVARADQLIE